VIAGTTGGIGERTEALSDSSPVGLRNGFAAFALVEQHPRSQSIAHVVRGTASAPCAPAAAMRSGFIFHDART
jgi:hypothetical protein